MCEFSSSILVQILKGSAYRHFIKVLRTNSIQSHVFIQSICQTEPDIAIYLCRGLFKDLKKTFNILKKDIKTEFDNLLNQVTIGHEQ